MSNFFNSWYPSYFFISAIIMFFLGTICYKYRNNLVAKYIFILMILNFSQSMFSIIEVTSENLLTMIWFRNVQQIPLFIQPIVLFFLVLEYIGKKRIVEKFGYYFFLPTIIYFFLIFTDHFHHLMRAKIDVIYFAGISKLMITSTPLSNIFITYHGVLIIIAFILLLINLKRATKYNRKQNIVMIIGYILIIGHETITSLLNIKFIEFKVLTYIPFGIVILFGIKNHRLFSIYPIAKDIVIENMKDGIIILDNEYRIIDCNPAAQDMVYTYSSKRLIEDSVASEETISIIKKHELSSGDKIDFSYSIEGDIKELELKISHIRARNGKKLGYLLVLHDVTEYKLLQRKSENSQRERLEYISNISHDIRNPLTSIIGFSNAILDGRASTNDTKYIQYIYDRSKMIQSLVEDLLEFTKLETRAIQFNLTQVNAKIYFYDLCHSMHEEIRTSGRIFTFQIFIDDFYILIDTIRIAQVIDNLISNAMKNTKKDDYIRFHVSKRKESIIVEITDTGVGIPPELQDCIFSRYYSTHTTSDSHGLGLAISKEIIEIHKGKIGVNSQFGQGSTFFFTLPIYRQGGVEI